MKNDVSKDSLDVEQTMKELYEGLTKHGRRSLQKNSMDQYTSIRKS